MGEKGYKGFQRGLICKGKQYKENTIFEEDSAVICKSGMHYCKNPFDVLGHYSLLDSKGNFNEFATVEALAEEKTDDNKKFCTTKLKIGAKLTFPGFVKACIDFTIENTKSKRKSASGDCSQLAASGDYSKLAASGNSSQLAASGDYSQLAASGDYSKLAASGNSSKLAASGNSSQLAASGNSSQLAASGDSSNLAASGNYSKLAASGAYSKLAASGNSSQLAASGNSSKLAASGNFSKLAASGNFSKAESTGKYSVICCTGHDSIAKAKKGSWITLSEWEWSKKEKCAIPVCVKTEFVDGERIKEDSFYELVNGEFVEVRI